MVDEIFLGDFLIRIEDFNAFALVRVVSLVDFGLLLTGVLGDFALARTGDFVFERRGGLVFERLVERDAFGFVRIVDFVGFAFGRATGLEDFANLLVFDFVAPAPLAFVALRAGALPASERLIVSVGRDDLPDIVRLFAKDVAAPRREAGPDKGRLTPLTVGSLIRSSKLSKKGHSNSLSCHII